MASETHKETLFGPAEDAEKHDYLEILGSFHFRPTLFVGVGGTGAQAVEKEKQLFLTFVGPQMKKNQNAAIADIDPLYQFLSFDTNRGEKKSLLPEGEDWLHLSVGDLDGFYNGVGRTPFYKSWLVGADTPGWTPPLRSLDAGAGGYRNFGRLALLHNIDKARDAIGKKIQTMMTAAASLKATDQVPNVHVFCSLSGGTGSGMLLDLCFLLRRMLPRPHRLIGHIAVLHGLPTVPQQKRQEVQRNTFAGLKELNAFMSGIAFNRGVPKGLHNDYPNQTSVYVEEPLDEVYLVGSNRHDGAISLPTQKHISSFMARLAFMMSAYSFAGDEPDYAGIIANHATSFDQKVGGARACYVVPGFAQVHFPVEKVAHLFALEAARAYMNLQSEGSSVDADADEFLKSENLQFSDLKQRVSKDPRNTKGQPLGPVAYDDQMKSLLGDRNRYQNHDEILKYGQKMPAGRLEEIEAILKPNLDAIYNDCWPKVLAAVRNSFERSDRLGRGALGFVNRLIHQLHQERDNLAMQDKKQVQPEYDAIPGNWQTVQPHVTEEVTDDGFFDRKLDSMRLPRVEALYVSFLNSAEVTTLERARNELTRGLIDRLCASLELQAKEIKELIEINLPAAIKLLEKKIRDVNTELYDQTEGKDDGVLNICSVNAMTQEWRQEYLDHRALTPAQVLANLIPKGDDAAAQWRPSDLISPQETAGMEVSHFIAQTIYDHVNPLFDEVRHWSPDDVLSMAETVGKQKPEDIIGAIYNKNAQPQMQIGAMKTRAGMAPYSLMFCGGITEALKTRLAKSEQLQGVVLNVANNQETQRINFACATLPVALAGCDLVVDILENEYSSWMRDLEKVPESDRELEKAYFHCFAGSAGWPSPTDLVAFDMKTLFAKALAVSYMLNPTERDVQRMRTAAAGVEDVRYSLFHAAGGSFWLWPFFEPDNPLKPITGELHTLGANLLQAFDRFESSGEQQTHAQQWINWFEDKWRTFFKTSEINHRIEEALDNMAKCKALSDDPEERQFWDKFAEIVSGWEIAKAARV